MRQDNLTLLTAQSSLLAQYIAELRDVTIQQDRMRFRRNIERCGEIMAYEISKLLTFHDEFITTPLAGTLAPMLLESPIIISILRAGLPLHNGVLNYFDKSDSGFISAFRNHLPDGSFNIVVEYLASPDINGKIVLLLDPMLATGQSIQLAYQTLLTNGIPSKLFVCSLIASQQGIAHIQDTIPDAHIFVCAIDEGLDEHSYIIPGLGDAGDLSFGLKM